MLYAIVVIKENAIQPSRQKKVFQRVIKNLEYEYIVQYVKFL